MITSNFGLNQTIDGMELMPYMAQLLEKNEKQQIEIERGKLTVSILKQMNNTSRLMIDAAKYELKKGEFDIKQANTPTNKEKTTKANE